jgi:hypothetical protein
MSREFDAKAQSSIIWHRSDRAAKSDHIQSVNKTSKNMTERKSNYLLPVIGAAVVAAGGAGAYFYFNQTGTLTPVVPGRLAIAKVVTKQALMLARFNPNPEAMAQLDRFQSPESKKILENGWRDVQKQTFQNTGINYEVDVKPWAGEIALAIIPITAPKASAQTFLPVSNFQTQLSQATGSPKSRFDALVVFAVKDKAGATQFAAKVQTQAKAKAKGKTSQSEYKGIQISQSDFGNGSSLNSATLGDYLVFSSQTNTLKNAIDTFNDGTAASSLEPEINPNQLQLKNSIFELYVTDFAGAIERGIAASETPASIPASSIDSLKRVKSLVMGVGVEQEGLRLKGIAQYDPKRYDLELKTSENKILSRFPSDTFAIGTGKDIKGRWSAIARDLEKDPETKKGLAEIRKSVKTSPVALDLDKDVFGWMDGEFALGLIASDKGILAQAGAAPAIMIQSSDRAAADATLKKIMDYAKSSGVKFNTRQVNGVEVTQWIQGIAFLAHGWNQDTLFITAEPLAETISGKPAASLDGNENFKSLISALGLPGNNLGYFYFDVAKAWEVYNRIAPAEVKSTVPRETKVFIESIRGLIASAVMSDQYTNRFDMLLALKSQASK